MDNGPAALWFIPLSCICTKLIYYFSQLAYHQALGLGDILPMSKNWVGRPDLEPQICSLLAV